MAIVDSSLKRLRRFEAHNMSSLVEAATVSLSMSELFKW